MIGFRVDLIAERILPFVPWVLGLFGLAAALWLLWWVVSGNARLSIAYWGWLWEHEYWWFQRKAPHKEISTRIYEGLPGSGKTLLMVRDCVELLRDGYIVYSNVAISDPYTGLTARPLGGWLPMLRASVECLEDHSRYQRELAHAEATGGDVCAVVVPTPVVFAFDEIHLAADARAWQSTPAWWLNLMAQRRHYSVGLIGTTQDLTTVEKRLRMLVGRLVQVRASGLRRLIKRLPLFVVQDIDLSLRGEGVGGTVSKPEWTWVHAHGFHGYSTREIMASVDFADLKTDEATAEVAALTERAIAAAGVSFCEAFLPEFMESSSV